MDAGGDEMEVLLGWAGLKLVGTEMKFAR